MKNYFLAGLWALCSLSACKKPFININRPAVNIAQTNKDGFASYRIKAGSHYCENNGYKAIELSELKFRVQFDSSAIYRTKQAGNQYDINKLYGFSDNDAQHHQYSARIGWRWSDGALRLFAYVYNNGAVTAEEITAVPIGVPVSCAISVLGSRYRFLVNETEKQLPRYASTAIARGYQLYPYFGGDETAPHEVTILIKEE